MSNLDHVLPQYRIRYWEGGREFHMVVGASDYDRLRDWCKSKYNRFKIEEVENDEASRRQEPKPRARCSEW
jgi:hypothetical protein